MFNKERICWQKKGKFDIIKMRGTTIKTSPLLNKKLPPSQSFDSWVKNIRNLPLLGRI
jgi:hypothetical protein